MFAGYNAQLDNNLVLGVEIDADYTWNKKKFQEVGVAHEHGRNWGGALRGRIGYAMGDALIYGVAGAAISNFYLDAGSQRSRQLLYGYSVGAGIDYELMDNIFTRLEYRYTGYPSASYLDDVYNNGGQATKSRASSNVVTIGLGAKF